MSWAAVYDSTTGKLLADCDEAAVGTVPPGASTRIYPSVPDRETLMWDPAVRDWVARPPAKTLRKKLDDLIAIFQANSDFAAVWGALSQSRKTQLRTGIETVMRIILRGLD